MTQVPQPEPMDALSNGVTILILSIAGALVAAAILNSIFN